MYIYEVDQGSGSSVHPPCPERSSKRCVLFGLHGFERLDRHCRISTFGRLGRHVGQDCLLLGVE